MMSFFIKEYEKKNIKIAAVKHYFRLSVLIGMFFISCKNGGTSSTADNSNVLMPTRGNQILFSLKLLTGTKYYYSSSTKTSINLEVENTKVKNINEATIGLTYEVLQSTADTTVIKLTYDKIHLELTSNDEKQVIDAGNIGEDQSSIDKLLGIVKGASIIIILNKKGQVLKTIGSKEITEKVLGGLGIYDDEQTKKTVKEQIGKLVGDDFIENTIGEGFNFYPDTTVLIGQSWSKKSLSQGELKFDTDTRYTLSSIEDGTAVISFQSQLTGNGTSKPISLMGQQVVADLSQKTTGNLETDMLTGMLVYGTTKSYIEGTIQVMAKLVPVEIEIKKELSVKKM